MRLCNKCSPRTPCLIYHLLEKPSLATFSFKQALGKVDLVSSSCDACCNKNVSTDKFIQRGVTIGSTTLLRKKKHCETSCRSFELSFVQVFTLRKTLQRAISMFMVLVVDQTALYTGQVPLLMRKVTAQII